MASLAEIARTDNWWNSKIPPVLAVAFLAALLFHVSPWALAEALAMILFVGLCAGAYGHFLNDAFDMEADRRAGKRNRMVGLPPWLRVALCLGALGLGFAPALLVPCSTVTLGLLALEYLFPSVYSIPPLRFKERGALGLVCDAMGAHAIPALYVMSVMADAAAAPPPADAATVATIALVLVWALCTGLKGIIVHEFADRADDLQAGVATFATATSFPRVRRSLNRIAGIELAAFTLLLLLLLPRVPLLAVAALAYAALLRERVMRARHFYLHAAEADVGFAWWQWSHAFYEADFPLILAAALAWHAPALAVVPVLLIVAFAGNFQTRRAEIVAFCRHVWVRALWGGWLACDGLARAQLSPSWPWACRVRFADPGDDPWNIRLSRIGPPVRRGQQYRMELVARAAGAREITMGLWRDHAPWDDLGLSAPVSVTAQWQTIMRPFAATADARHSYFGLWVGGDAMPLQIRALRLIPTGSPPPP